MSQFDEKCSEYKKVLEDLGYSVNDQLLTSVTKGLGPSIYNNDASRVSSSDPKEVDRVKENFITKKLGISDDAEVTKVFTNACEKIGTSNPNKWRAVMYYIMATETGKESNFS